MRSSSWLALAGLLIAGTASAQSTAEGFAVERFAPTPAGGGWLVMDDLAMHGSLGGALSLSSGYAHAPLHAAGLALVQHQAFVDFGFAITTDRYRLSLDLSSPLVIDGDSGVAGGAFLRAPKVDVGTNPDTLGDARIGLDARVSGEHDGPVRVGISAQLWVPSGERSDYVTDGSYRFQYRVLAAGDVGRLTYAGYAGVHIRTTSERDVPDGPRGSELLFGMAAGPRFGSRRLSFVIGPEFWGETAFSSFFASSATGFEGLLAARVESTHREGSQFRVKLGAGGGLNARFGAPAVRAVLSVEVSGHTP